MGKKDKRIKGCPDPDCARHNEHYKYKPTDLYCTLCGSQLVYVCAKCFEEIEDTEDQRRFCENCKPVQSKDGDEAKEQLKEQKKKEKEEKKEEKKKEKEENKKEKEEKKEAARAQKPPKEKKEKESGKGKETVAKSVAVIKGKAPQIKEGAIKIAKNPNVQRAALEVAEIAKDGIRHRKTRRIVGVLIRAANAAKK